MESKNSIFAGPQLWVYPTVPDACDVVCEMPKCKRVLSVNTPLASGEGRRNERPYLIGRTDIIRRRELPLHRIDDDPFALDPSFRDIPANSFPDGWLSDMTKRFDNLMISAMLAKLPPVLGSIARSIFSIITHPVVFIMENICARPLTGQPWGRRSYAGKGSLQRACFLVGYRG